jgi:hypothetical protein
MQYALCYMPHFLLSAYHTSATATIAYCKIYATSLLKLLLFAHANTYFYDATNVDKRTSPWFYYYKKCIYCAQIIEQLCASVVSKSGASLCQKLIDRN